MKLRATPTLAIMGVCVVGCAAAGELRHSTEESSNEQLESARRSGFETEIMVTDEAIDAEALMADHSEMSAEATYLVLTGNDAKIIWGEALRDVPPHMEAAIVGRWVVPYIRSRDPDTALKAFVFGYLQALHEAGRIEWDTAVVPFLPPHSPVPVKRTFRWGVPLAMLAMLLVVWSDRTRPRVTAGSPTRGVARCRPGRFALAPTHRSSRPTTAPRDFALE